MIIKQAIGLGFAGALALGVASPTLAAPVSTNTAGLKAAVPTERVDVQWRGQRRAWRGGRYAGHGGYWRGGRWYGPGAVAGLAAGAAVGAFGAAAATAAAPFAGPYYGDPAYDAYAYSPSYGYGYGSGYEGCITDEGYGRTSRCDNN